MESASFDSYDPLSRFYSSVRLKGRGKGIKELYFNKSE